jgi:hypothetical protein
VESFGLDLSVIATYQVANGTQRKLGAGYFRFDKIFSMLAMLHDLVQHKGYANAVVLKAVRQHEKATQDQELRELLHHIILANRFWLSFDPRASVRK